MVTLTQFFQHIMHGFLDGHMYWRIRDYCVYPHNTYVRVHHHMQENHFRLAIKWYVLV